MTEDTRVHGPLFRCCSRAYIQGNGRRRATVSLDGSKLLPAIKILTILVSVREKHQNFPLGVTVNNSRKLSDRRNPTGNLVIDAKCFQCTLLSPESLLSLSFFDRSIPIRGPAGTLFLDSLATF